MGHGHFPNQTSSLELPMAMEGGHKESDFSMQNTPTLGEQNQDTLRPQTSDRLKVSTQTFRSKPLGVTATGHKPEYKSVGAFAKWNCDLDTLLSIQAKIEQFRCNECGMSFKFKDFLDHHVCANAKAPFSCQTCDKSFSTKELFQQHILSCRLPESKMTLPKYNSETISFQEVSGPVVSAGSSYGWQCEFCFKAFTSEAEMTEHLYSHDDIFPFRCHLCFMAFKQSSSLRKHVLGHKYRCEVCAQSFNSKTKLTEHAYNSKCSKCGRKFSNIICLQKHMNKYHTPIIKCLYCPEQFLSFQEMKRHTRSHNKGLLRFQCSRCPKTFAMRKSLKLHRNIHTQEKPFKCSYKNRNKAFHHDTELSARLIEHEPWQLKCQSCGMEFKSVSDLRYHRTNYCTVAIEFKVDRKGRAPTSIRVVRASDQDKMMSPRDKGICSPLEPSAEPVRSSFLQDAVELGTEYSKLQAPVRQSTEVPLVKEDSSTDSCWTDTECGRPDTYEEDASTRSKLQAPVRQSTEVPLVREDSSTDSCWTDMESGRPDIYEEDPSALRKELSTLKLSANDKEFCSYLRTSDEVMQLKRAESKSDFIGKDDLVKHSTEACHGMINGQKQFECDLCEKCFRSRGGFTKHRRVHTREKSFTCFRCDKKFRSKWNLNGHVLRIHHTGKKQKQCSICGKCFHTNSELVLHTRVHTGEKPFQCSHCEKAFQNSSGLARHVRIHTGEKPHGCSHCDRRFADYKSMKEHMLIHTDERPHQCSICGRRFRQKQAYRHHLFTHTGKRPFICACGRSFTQRSLLNWHQRKHCVLRREQNKLSP